MSAVFYIKNMVCDRCKMVVRESFERISTQVIRVDLGEVETTDPLTPTQISTLTRLLEQSGFELIDEKPRRIVEKIKTLLIDLIHYQSINDVKVNYSAYLSEQLHRDYSGLSTLFSSQEGITIEQYIIRQKIERVKELLTYDELSLSQIADELDYSSVAHLSNQFKKVTGQTPSQFKQARAKNRLPLDQV